MSTYTSRITALVAFIILALPLSTASVLAEDAKTVRLSEPVVKDETSETFGSKLNTSLELLELTQLMDKAEEYQSKPFRLQTKIAKVCQKKGCFFIAQQQDTVVRVSFKDYSFFIPSDSGGKTVMLHGNLVKKEVTEAQAAHFAEDLKSSNSPVKAGVTYEIVADSIKIPLS